MPTNENIPTNEYFPKTDESGKVILFHVYLDTILLTEQGGCTDPVTAETSAETFIKKITTKFQTNFVSLLKSITNTSCANLSQDMLNHLFDSTGHLYNHQNYEKSVFALLQLNNIRVSQFYNTDENPIVPTKTDKDCNEAYFTFKLKFKYKLLEFVVQFEIGHDIHSDTNIFTDDTSTITGNLDVCKQLNVNTNATISQNLYVGSNTCLDKNLTVDGNTTLRANLSVGNDCNDCNVVIYGVSGSKVEWTGSTSTLDVQGSLVVGSDIDTSDPQDGADNTYPVVFHSLNGKFEWKNNDDKLSIDGNLDLTKDLYMEGNLTIGSNVSNPTVIINGTDNTKYMKWNDSSPNTLKICGNLIIGEACNGGLFKLNSIESDKYVEWDPDSKKLQINGSICGGVDCAGVSLKLFGTNSGKLLAWNNSIDNADKLTVIGNVDIGSSDNRTQVVNVYGNNNSLLNWNGTEGTLTNSGKTVLEGQTDIKNNLTVGIEGSNYDLTVLSSQAGKELKWTGSDHTLSVKGILNVDDNTTLNGAVNTHSNVTFEGGSNGKLLCWNKESSLLKVMGETNLNGSLTVNAVGADCDDKVTINCDTELNNSVVVNNSLTVGMIESGKTVKFYGSGSNNCFEWNGETGKLQINGDVEILNGETVIQNDLIINNDTEITGPLDVSGITTFSELCNFESNVCIKQSGGLTLEGGIIGDTPTYIEWIPNIDDNPSKLTIKSNVDMCDNKLSLIDNDLTIESCTNSNFMKWTTSDSMLKVNAEKTLISGEIEITNDILSSDPTSSIKWDNNNSLILESNVLLTGENYSLELNNGGSYIVWNQGGNDKLLVNSNLHIKFAKEDWYVSSDYESNTFSINTYLETTRDISICGQNGNIVWYSETSILNSNALIESHGELKTYNDIYINGSLDCANKNIQWKSSEGKLNINGELHLQDTGENTRFVNWKTDTLTVNADLDVKQGNLSLYNIDEDLGIQWNYSDNTLFCTGCIVKLQDNNLENKIEWDGSSSLNIVAQNVNIESSTILRGFEDKSINWDALTGEYIIDAEKLFVTSPSNFKNDILCESSNGRIEWVYDTDLLTVEGTTNFVGTTTVTGDTTLDGDVELVGSNNDCKIVWDKSEDSLTATADITLSGVDSTYSTSWNKEENRLTVTGSLIKTPHDSNELSGDVQLDMQQNNNFNLSLCGNINLTNPHGLCPGQEGRIVIQTNGSGRNITFGNYWLFENSQCIELSQNATNAIDVLVYYVMANDKVLVKIEKNYGACPPPSDC